jgi:hypothetical protein
MCTAQAFNGAIGDLASFPNPGSSLNLGLFPSVDTLTFSLSAPTIAAFAIQSQALNLGFVIPGATGLTLAVYKGGSLLTGPGTSFSGMNLVAGTDYSFKVTGTTTGLYTVNWALSPVPEPQVYALVFAGLGAVGTLMRRRREA